MSVPPARPAKLKSWYDMPRYYDMVYADYTRRETRFIQQILKQYRPELKTPARILEPACGSGRLLVSLAQAGHEVQGFDANPRMVRYARQQLRQAKVKGVVWQDQLQGFKAPSHKPFDLAHCFVSTFKYLLKEREAVQCLQRIAASLKPDGIFLLGLHLTNYQSNPDDYERWSRREGDLKVVSETWSQPAQRRTRTEAMQTRMHIHHAQRTAVWDTFWKFRTYSVKELKSLLKKVPALTLRGCYDFRYNLRKPRRFNQEYSDIILVLQRQTPKHRNRSCV